jgi:hypothetical protein
LIYNRSTTYSPPGTIEASRVVGGRYEFGVGVLPNAHELRLLVDLMPSLVGTIHTTFPGDVRLIATRACSRSLRSPTTSGAITW